MIVCGLCGKLKRRVLGSIWIYDKCDIHDEAPIPVRMLQKECIEMPLYRDNNYPEWAYVTLWEKQDGLCLGCGLELQPPMTCGIREKNWGWIDHDHTTMVVRGLLCHSCNVKDVLR